MTMNNREKSIFNIAIMEKLPISLHQNYLLFLWEQPALSFRVGHSTKYTLFWFILYKLEIQVVG